MSTESKETKKQNNEIAIPTTAEVAFPILNPDAEIAAIMQENLGDDGYSFGDLTTVKIPAGGATIFEIEGVDGTESSPELIGIISMWHTSRGYWVNTMDEDGESDPDCASPDGVIGVGNPGGECGSCPMGEYGSAKQGGGKACKEKKILYMVRPGSILPTKINVPPTSLKHLRKYMTQLAASGVPYWTVVTKITVEKCKSNTNKSYGEMRFSRVETLPAESKPALKAYHQQLHEMVVRSNVDRIDAMRRQLSEKGEK